MGVLLVDATVTEKGFSVKYVSYSRDSRIGEEYPIGENWKHRGLYSANPNELEDSVRESFKTYLKDRGLDSTHASLIVQYVGKKKSQVCSQPDASNMTYSPSVQEHVEWHKNVKSFVCG
ncbi:hypothetical protein AX15_002865 [Amanita polypyramis BW_CC]|nr:hypothetical protein AX15_002865 [Amanita polypyramis BW_CC]